MDRDRLRKLVIEMTTSFTYDSPLEDNMLIECKSLIYAVVGSSVRLTRYLGVVCSHDAWPMTDDLPFSLLPDADVVRHLQTGLDGMDSLDFVELVLNPAAMHQLYARLHGETVDGVARGWVEGIRDAILEAMGK